MAIQGLLLFASMSKKRKIRADFRKNREVRTRHNDLTARFSADDTEDDEIHQERVRAKGNLSRKRTLADAEIVEDDCGRIILPKIDTTKCRPGRVVRVQGLISVVEDNKGRVYHCATRRLLKTLSTDQRHVVAAGDHVWFRVADPRSLPPCDKEESGELRVTSTEVPSPASSLPPVVSEGIIERVEPRTGVLSRTSRGRQHVIVANVDQLVIVSSAARPRLKPNLIDRLLVTAERARIRPVICINKADLVQPADVIPLMGVYGQLGYDVLVTSATCDQGIDRLRSLLQGNATVFTGQSGVGKSSLLNAVEPGLNLRVRAVSEETQKGRHTTSTAELIRLSALDQEGADSTTLAADSPAGATYVIDTPGIRQFQLWDVIPEEVAGFFRDLRPYVSHCRFPDCTHTHEEDCAVKDAVADGWIDTRRYESYVQMTSDE